MNVQLENIKEKALSEHIPILMDDTLNVIIKYLKEEKPKRLLEIGTATGYSALNFIQNMEQNSIIDTIECDEQRAKEAMDNINILGYADRINIIMEDAVKILQTLNREYDIIFIDAAKGKYPIFLREAVRLVKNNGLIIADNVLYKGYVLGDYNKRKQRTAVNRLREFLREIKENEIFDSIVLEVGDGLSITRVKK